MIKNMLVIRPLLNYRKSELIDYCNNNNIRFNNDESNLDPKYQRNKIRNTIINNMSLNTREKYLKEIALAQLRHDTKQLKFISEYNKIIKNSLIDVSLYSHLSNENKIKSLYKFIAANSSVKPNLLSSKRLNNISNQILSIKPNLKIKINDSFFLVKSYNSLSISSNTRESEYKYVIKQLSFKKFNEFKISKTGLRLEGVFIDKSDLPLTIRSYRPEDKVVIKDGHKQVSRLFIDSKVAKNIRSSIPVVVNIKGEILLVSNYYVNPERKRLQSNVFVVKC
jgi:tRNA(Ile)-lysidine synthetase-like protein